MPFLTKKGLYFRFTKLTYVAENALILLIMTSLVGLVLVNVNPLDSLPGRDSGSFLYAGSQILQGGLPYADFWDSKGPAIFYVNALGLLVGKNTRWGGWLLEFLFLTTSSLLIYEGIKHKWGRGAALFANILWLYGFSQVFQGGNLTEEYPLLFNFWVLAYFLKTNGNTSKRLSFLIGFTLAVSFLFRANNIGVQISFLIALFILSLYKKKITQFVKLSVSFLLGLSIPLVLVSVYFWSKGLFEEMFNAAITYNFYYSGKSFGALNFRNGVLNIGWPSYVALLGYIILIIQLFHPNKKIKLDSIFLFLIINFPVEIMLSSISGRGYPHYFISWMPSIAVLGAFAYAHLSPEVFSIKLRAMLDDPYKVMKILVPVLLIVYWDTGSMEAYKRITTHLLFERDQGVEKIDPTARFIKNNTTKDQTVLVWGANPGINFLSSRFSSTAYVFYPLYVASPFSEKMGSEFYEELTTNKPKFIVDYADTWEDNLLSLNPEIRQSQQNKKNFYDPPYQNEVLSFIDSNYHFITTIYGNDIYLLSDP